MVTSDETEDNLYKKHKDLCRIMNLDQQITSQAWESFMAVNNNLSLEVCIVLVFHVMKSKCCVTFLKGDPLHWLGCAVFVACRETITPTVGQAFVEGNCVNLTSLLRHCNLR